MGYFDMPAKERQRNSFSVGLRNRFRNNDIQQRYGRLYFWHRQRYFDATGMLIL